MAGDHQAIHETLLAEKRNNNLMQILYLAHRIPYPPNKGEKIRAFHQIRCLAREHRVHLACLIDTREDREHVVALEKYCASVAAVYRGRTVARLRAVLALSTNIPLSVAAFYSRELQRRIAQRLRTESIDRIVVFSSSMAAYVRQVTDIPKVMDFVDVDSEKWRLYADYHPFPAGWVYRQEAQRLARYEEAVARTFDQTIFVSEKEAELFRQRVADRPVSVIPNGVDLDYFCPRADDQGHSGHPVLVFTGVMDYLPNIDAVQYFCREVFPLIRKVMPQVWFYIVGRNPSQQVRALGRQPQVVVTGTVPDVRPYLEEARVAVVPLRLARGVQNKVLEAMAMGVPVVGTSVAFQGTQATAADGIQIADDPERFAQAVLTLLRDPELRHQCARQARQYVQQYHQWQDHGTRLVSLLQEMPAYPGATTA